MRIALIVASTLAIFALTGCGKRLQSCKQDNKSYVGAPELPPLKAPEGLEAPNTRNGLKVPPLNTPERARTKNEPCLDMPPPYSTTKTAPTPAPAPAPTKPRDVSTE